MSVSNRITSRSADLDDLVLDLDPRRAAHDDVDLLLPLVLVPERDAEVRVELHVAEAEAFALDRPAAESRLDSSGMPNFGAAFSTSFLRFFFVYPGMAAILPGLM